MKNTVPSIIVCFTILVLPVLLDEEYWSFQYCVLQYQYYQYCWMKNTGASSIVFYNTSITSIVCFKMLVLPVLLDEEYCTFHYRVFYNTSITSIVE